MAPTEPAKEKADKDRAGRLQRARSDYMKGMPAYDAATSAAPDVRQVPRQPSWHDEDGVDAHVISRPDEAMH
jgi:hypothetical protein